VGFFVRGNAESLLLGFDENEKAKTSAQLMFLKGFGYDQCEKDATEREQSSLSKATANRKLQSNHPMGFE